MKKEIKIAIKFIKSILLKTSAFPPAEIDCFLDCLETSISEKFMGHWYPDNSLKGNGYRAITNYNGLDSVFTEAAIKSNVSVTLLENCLPFDISLWIDPNEVSYRIGDTGLPTVLYTALKYGSTGSVSGIKCHKKRISPNSSPFPRTDSRGSPLTKPRSSNNLYESPTTTPERKRLNPRASNYISNPPGFSLPNPNPVVNLDLEFQTLETNSSQNSPISAHN